MRGYVASVMAAVSFRFLCRYVTLLVAISAILVLLHIASTDYKKSEEIRRLKMKYGRFGRIAKLGKKIDKFAMDKSRVFEESAIWLSKQDNNNILGNNNNRNMDLKKNYEKMNTVLTKPESPKMKKKAVIPSPKEHEYLLRTKRSGFVTALDYWDQQTYSIQNILSLQKFAAWLDVEILEPFLIATKFGLPLYDKQAFHTNGSVSSYLTFSDVYDLKRYNRDISAHGAERNPLISWGTFLETAARDVIFVNINGMTNFYSDVTKLNKTLTKLGFKILREIRIKVSDTTEEIFESDLKTNIYDNHGIEATDVTVIFNVWNRKDFPYVFVHDHLDMMSIDATASLSPSKRLNRDAMKYKLRYMKSVSDNYIGILVRAEWLILTEDRLRKVLLQNCLQKSLDRLQNVTKEKGISKVFVGMDIGRYGSKTMDDLNRGHIIAVGEEFLQSAYQDRKMTLDSWEDTFTKVSSSLVPGYIANLEKLIAIQGRCLMLIGFGSFQSNALRMYVERHVETCVLRTDMSCNLTYNDVY